MDKKRLDKNVLMNALWNAFPSVASFNDFKEKDRDISERSIPRIIKYAYDNGIIDKDNEKAFLKFLAQNNKVDADKPLLEELIFSDVIETLAGNVSVNSLIQQLEIITKNLSLPKIKATMITRLKKNFVLNTPKKRILLRILAYKLAEKRPDLNWHYEMLSKLPASSARNVKESGGITITLHLQGNTGIILPNDVQWLKAELSKCIEYLHLAGHVNKKTIASNGASTFSLRLAKKSGPLEEPRLYNRAVRDILAITHQMAVRWLLYEYSSPQKHLVIIIHAGLMSEANLFTQPFLETKISGGSGIYLSDFAYLCARVADVKVGFEYQAKRSVMSNSYSGNIWSVNYFWTHNYYDYIPCLLEDRMLPQSSSDPAYNDFQLALHFPEQFAESPFAALRALHRFPQQDLLLIEIAKVLRVRQLPYDADAVISTILLFNPHNVIARVLRMVIHFNIAHAHSDFIVSELAFNRAVAEGEFIVEHCDTDSEFWCEFGVVYFGRAIKYIKCLRENNSSYCSKISQGDILNCLQKASECFLQGMTVSSTGKDINSLFWFGYTSSFIELFSSDEALLAAGEHKPLVDNNNVFGKVSLRIFREIGWFNASDDNINETASQNLLKILSRVSARYENSMLSRNFIPYMKYLFGLLLWDFSPKLTYAIGRLVLSLLLEASTEAAKLVKENICVYRSRANYIAPDKFIAQIQETTDMIKKYIPEDEIKEVGDSHIDKNKLEEMSKIKLMLLEIDRY